MKIAYIETMVAPEDTSYIQLTEIAQGELYEELLNLISLGSPTRVRYEDGSMREYNIPDSEHIQNYNAFQDEAVNGYQEVI